MIFILIYTLFLFAYYIIIGYFIFGCFALNILGAFNILFFEYGSIAVILIFILLTITGLILPILVIKLRRLFKILVLIAFLLMYCFIPGGMLSFMNYKYSKFSYNEWNEHPAVRQIMYLDLLDVDGIIGKSPSEVKEEVGTPDYEEKDGEKIYVFAYKTSPGTVRVYFDNNIVESITYTPSW